jgi:hypothetical protein
MGTQTLSKIPIPDYMKFDINSVHRPQLNKERSVNSARKGKSEGHFVLKNGV